MPIKAWDVRCMDIITNERVGVALQDRKENLQNLIKELEGIRGTETPSLHAAIRVVIDDVRREIQSRGRHG